MSHVIIIGGGAAGMMAAITAAEDWFAERGVKKIFINSRTEAVGFYEKLGYVADPKQITGTGAFQCIMTEKQL